MFFFSCVLSSPCRYSTRSWKAGRNKKITTVNEECRRKKKKEENRDDVAIEEDACHVGNGLQQVVSTQWRRMLWGFICRLRGMEGKDLTDRARKASNKTAKDCVRCKHNRWVPNSTAAAA